MRAALAMSAARPLVTGLPEKFCHNVYAEPNPTDPARPMVLMETPGSLKRNTFASACRGMWQADGHASGKVLIGQGSTLSTFDPATNTAGSLTGSIAGTDRGDCAFTEQQAMFLFDGQPYISDGTYIRRASDGVLDDPNLAIGSTPANVATGAFDYSINGVTYSKGAVAAGTAPGNDVVPLGLYGAVALDIDSAGTITAIEAPANATGYASASLAAAALPTVLTTRVRIGYVTASKSDGAFTFGTTSLAAANTTVAYTDSAVNTGYTDLLADHGQTGFTSVAALGQRFLLTYGSRFCFTDVLDGFATTSLNYYTAESSPDTLIAGRVINNVYYLFGTRTIEPWVQSGDSDDPFALQEGLIQQTGAACRDGIVESDNTLFFIDDAFNPCRLGSGSSVILNPEDPWVSDLLQDAGAENIIALGYSDRAHTFAGWRTPDGCVFYDGLTRTWHTRGTLNTDTWRYTAMVEADARVFVMDGTGQFDELGRDYLSESMATTTTMGTEIQRRMTAILPTQAGRLAIKTVKIEGSKGIGLSTGQGSDPLIQMRQSKDGGNTFTSWMSRKLGLIGVYDQRSIWRRRGRARDQGVVFEFRKSDPVRAAYTGVLVNEDGPR
jgi:hypothetical protein